ncbi:MAG: alpha/beta hydrolase [Clostridiales Family XIII bacterium]|jgi:acetyl esterase/lipase|nr:alpha/beta hydrolase [Clostridiales Family XIII bacterium]
MQQQHKIETIALPGGRADVFLQRFVLPDEAEGLRPPVIICPGGGYFVIGTSEGEPVARRFIAAGYAPFILHYSIAKSARFDRGAHPPLLAVQDLGEAAACVLARAEEWGLDAERLVLAGFSAGGHVTATYIGESISALPSLPLPAAALLVYPLIRQNPLHVRHPGESPDADDVRGLQSYYMFGLEGPSDEDLAVFDAAHRVATGWPPTFLYHSRDDQMVPFESSERLDAVLTQHGVPHVFHAADEGIHAHPFEHDEWWQPFIDWLGSTL